MPKRINTFIKPVGTGANPLPVWWLDYPGDLLTHVGFPQKPNSIRSGDLLVYYAAGHKKMFAVVRSTMNGEDCPIEITKGEERWPYRLAIQVLSMVPNIKLGVDYEVLGKGPHWIGQKPSVALEDATYEAFLNAWHKRVSLDRYSEPVPLTLEGPDDDDPGRLAFIAERADA